MSKNPVQSAAARLAVAQRPDRNSTPEQIAEARHSLLLARTERAIAEAVRPSDPDYAPLRQEDRDRLANTLRAG